MLGPGVEASPVVTQVPTPWFEGPLLPLPESQRQEDYPQAMAGRRSVIAPTPRSGTGTWLLWTAQGVTPPLRFVVGDLPEIVEDEIDGDPSRSR